MRRIETILLHFHLSLPREHRERFGYPWRPYWLGGRYDEWGFRKSHCIVEIDIQHKEVYAVFTSMLFEQAS